MLVVIWFMSMVLRITCTMSFIDTAWCSSRLGLSMQHDLSTHCCVHLLIARRLFVSLCACHASCMQAAAMQCWCAAAIWRGYQYPWLGAQPATRTLGGANMRGHDSICSTVRPVAGGPTQATLYSCFHAALAAASPKSHTTSSLTCAARRPSRHSASASNDIGPGARC